MAHGQKVEGQKIGQLKTTSEQAKKSQTNKARHRNKWWLIETTNNEEGETTNNEEGGEYGVDYQNGGQNHKLNDCRSLYILGYIFCCQY